MNNEGAKMFEQYTVNKGADKIMINRIHFDLSYERNYKFISLNSRTVSTLLELVNLK